MSKEKGYEMTQEELKTGVFSLLNYFSHIYANFQPILFNALINHNTLIIELFRAARVAPSERIDQLQVFVDGLMAQGYDIHDAPWDGNCFFSSIAQYLNSIRHNTDHSYLRTQAANYMSSHFGEFSGFIDYSHIFSLMTPGTAADQPDIQALAQAMNLNIHIHNVDGATTDIISNMGAQNIDLGYTGRHYFLLTPHVEAPLGQLLGLPFGYHQSDL